VVYGARGADCEEAGRVGSKGTHSDPSNLLWLDGKATNTLNS